MNQDDQPLAEQDIVRGLQLGDPAAWDALCDQFAGRVWAFVIRLVGADESAVSDVFQDTFLAASKAGRNLHQKDNRLWAWLAQIAHNQAANHWRRVYRDRPDSTVEGMSTEAGAARMGSELDPVELLARRETVDAVRRVLAEMSGDYVAVLTAKYLDGHSVSQMVSELGGTTEAVRSRLARARREFKLKFERMEGIHRKPSSCEGQ